MQKIIKLWNYQTIRFSIGMMGEKCLFAMADQENENSLPGTA